MVLLCRLFLCQFLKNLYIFMHVLDFGRFVFYNIGRYYNIRNGVDIEQLTEQWS